MPQNGLNRRTFLKGLGLAAGASMMPGYQMFGQLADFVTLGAVVPLTGQLASFGPRFQVAAQLAVDEVNEAGGIPGLGLLRLEVRDSGTNPDQGVAAAEELVNVVGVQALFGAAASGVTIPISSVTVANQVVQISPSATSPAITALDDNDYLFRTAPSDESQGLVLAHLASVIKGYSKVAVISRNDAYGAGLTDVFKNAFENDFGGTVTSVSLYDPMTQDFSAEIAEAVAGEPDAILPITFDEGEGLISQMVAQDVTNFDLFVDGNKNQDLIDRIVASIGPELLEGIQGTGPSPAPTIGGSEFDVRMRAALDEDPFIFTPHSYDALAILALAITAAGEYSGPEIRDRMRVVSNPPGEIVTVGQLAAGIGIISDGGSINYEGAAGSQDFDAAGDPEGPQGIWEIQDGRIVDLSLGACGRDADGALVCSITDL